MPRLPRTVAAALRSLPLLLVVLAALDAVSVSANPRVLPEPRQWAPGEGRLELGRGARIAVKSGEAEDLFAAGLLRDEIAARTGVAPEVVTARDGSIEISRESGTPALGEEGYRITVDSRRARITAATGAGVFYAVQTLRQMVEPTGIPAGTIEDAPSLRWRGLHDDISRGPLPTVETLKRRIELAAELKYNLYFLYLETALAYAAHPLLATPGAALDSSEVGELARFARERHIELVPEQQTTGHMERVLRHESYQHLAEVPRGTTLAPEAATYDFVRSLVDELDPMFPGTFLHLGGDEPGDWGRGRSQARVANGGLGGLYAEHAKRLAEIAESRGRRLLLWADLVVEHPEVAPRLPRNVMYTSWCYEALPDYSRWIRPFADSGREFLVCPGTANWNRLYPNLDVALPNIRDFVSQGRDAGARGMITCVWSDNGDAPFDLNWYALAAGASAAWRTAKLDSVSLAANFDWFLLRSPQPHLARAIERLQQVHRLVKTVSRYDANLELYWLHPLGAPVDNAALVELAPVADVIQLRTEEALVEIARARSAARRNPEFLETFDFAARRLGALASRARIARQVASRFRDLQDAERRRNDKDFLRALHAIQAGLGEGREMEVALREQQERLWLRDHRPHGIGNLLARYDRDIGIWTDRIDQFRRSLTEIRIGMSLPRPQDLGIGP